MAGNPFRYGDVATKEYFTNRVRELAEVREDITNGQNIVIISPRRYGKTSLLYEAMRLLRAEGVLVAYVDLFRAPTKDRFADLLAAAVYSGLVSPIERAWKDTMGLFQKLPIQPRITIGPDGMPSFEFSAGQHSRDIDHTIEELLALPGRIARERGRRVAVVFDEFQQVLGIDEHLPGLMRAVFQTQGEVAHIFLGSRRHLMQDVFTNQHQPLYKMAKPILLAPIETAAFAAYIQARFAETRQPIADDAIAEILRVTGGHPHDTQELCYFLWAQARARGLAGVEAGAVEAALGQVLDAESAHFITLWTDLSVHQRLVLLALSAEPGAVYSEAYRQAHRLGSAASVQRSITRLVDLEIIEQHEGTVFTLCDVFFREWIDRRAR
ncbi:MAG TPA: ATP-binding protein [Chloroflexota bacterium]|nr:ATP-binding protein [Chloroflexota bacterium]